MYQQMSSFARPTLHVKHISMHSSSAGRPRLTIVGLQFGQQLQHAGGGGVQKIGACGQGCGARGAFGGTHARGMSRNLESAVTSLACNFPNHHASMRLGSTRLGRPKPYSSWWWSLLTL